MNGRVVMSRRSDDKPVLQFCNQFVQERVAIVNALAVVKCDFSLISSELPDLHCFGSSADDLFQLLGNQHRVSYSILTQM